MSTKTSSTNPYAPTPREWTNKKWLYKQYWGKVKTIHEVANQTDVSRQTILREMKQKGIPRRPSTVTCETPEDVARMYRSNDRGNAHSTSFSTPTRTWDELHD